MPPTYTVTQYCPLHPTAQAYPAWSIHFITAPPCTLPPKFTSVGSARNRSVISRSLSSIAVAFYWAKLDGAPSVSSVRKVVAPSVTTPARHSTLPSGPIRLRGEGAGGVGPR